MRFERRLTPHRDHIAVALAYAATYQVMYVAMAFHWVLTAGLRMGCVLFVPRKYWPALAVGEMIPILAKTLSNAHKFGTFWAVTSSCPAILVSMGVFVFFRRYMPLRDHRGKIRVDTVLAVALVTSLVMVVEIYVLSFPAYLSYPDPIKGWLDESVPISLCIVIGNYLGVLTIVPMALVLYETAHHPHRTARWRSLLHETLLLVAPYLAIVVAAAKTDNIGASTFAQLAVMLPVISLSANHGKMGAAVSAMLSSIALHCIFNTRNDPAMLRAEGMLALVITFALMSTWSPRPVRTFSPSIPPWLRNGRAFSYFERGLGWTGNVRRNRLQGSILGALSFAIAVSCATDPSGGPTTLYAQVFLALGITGAWIAVNSVRANTRLTQREPGRSARIRQPAQGA